MNWNRYESESIGIELIEHEAQPSCDLREVSVGRRHAHLQMTSREAHYLGVHASRFALREARSAIYSRQSGREEVFQKVCAKQDFFALAFACPNLLNWNRTEPEPAGTPFPRPLRKVDCLE